jgi:hypothetical protein
MAFGRVRAEWVYPGGILSCLYIMRNQIFFNDKAAFVPTAAREQ